MLNRREESLYIITVLSALYPISICDEYFRKKYIYIDGPLSSEYP